MSEEIPKVLIVEARFYDEIADELVRGAVSVLDNACLKYDRLVVPGVFEIPSAINLLWNRNVYVGCISLGCVIRGETDHYEHISREVSRKLMDICITHSIPHGFGILTCETIEQARERSDVNKRNYGGRSAEACLRMLEINGQTLKD